MKPDGIVIIDKPTQMTSFGVVARIRRVLSQQVGAKVKVGHTGTLDPFASGLMVLVIGAACKRAGEFSKLDKVYEATIRLGQTSSTGDPEGDITDVSSEQPSYEEIVAACDKFRGSITQRPPIYSAIKIGGVRAYARARAGETIEIPERTVQVFSLELIDYTYPELRIRTHVSSGTYIRSMAVDIGEELGVGAYCIALRRTRVGKYDISDATALDAAMTGPNVEPI